MLSNQGQAVNLRDGSPLYPSNFIQRDNQDGHRLPPAFSCSPPLPLNIMLTKIIRGR